MYKPVACNHRCGLQAAMELNLNVLTFLSNGIMVDFRDQTDEAAFKRRTRQLVRDLDGKRGELWVRQDYLTKLTSEQLTRYRDLLTTALTRAFV